MEALGPTARRGNNRLWSPLAYGPGGKNLITTCTPTPMLLYLVELWINAKTSLVGKLVLASLQGNFLSQNFVSLHSHALMQYSHSEPQYATFLLLLHTLLSSTLSCLAHSLVLHTPFSCTISSRLAHSLVLNTLWEIKIGKESWTITKTPTYAGDSQNTNHVDHSQHINHNVMAILGAFSAH